MAKRQKRSHSPNLTNIHAPGQKRTRSNANVNTNGAHPQHTDVQTPASTYRPMNAVPSPASHPRPARQLFICGSGAFGQLGMGSTEEAMGELRIPKPHVWFEFAVQGESHMLGAERGAGIESAVAGGMHSLVIDELGRVWSWGVNNHGALGRQTINVEDPDAPGQLIEPEILEYTPMPVPKLIDEGFRAVQVAAGDSISVALSSEGKIRAWGCFRAADGLLGFRPRAFVVDTDEERSGARETADPVEPEESLPQREPSSIPYLEGLEDSRFVQIACGSNHVLALSERGVVYCWGNGQHGELGRKIVERHKVNGLVPTRILVQRLVYVAAGAYHSFAIDEDGVVYAWGLNSFRQTGVEFPEGYEGDRDVLWHPMRVEALDPVNLNRGADEDAEEEGTGRRRRGKRRRVIQIAGGEHHTLFLLNDGSVYACGRCDASELGLGADHPSMIEALKDPTIENENKTRGTYNYTLLEGYVRCIDRPTLLHFPLPPTPSTNPDPPFLPYPSSPSSSSSSSRTTNPIARIAASARHSFSVSRAGHVYAWGLGLVGELGLGEGVTEQETPRRVRSASLDEIRKHDGEVKWKWIVEDVSAGGQHTLFVVRSTS